MLIEPYLTVTLSFATTLSFLTKSQAKTAHGLDFYFHGKVKFDIYLHYAETQITWATVLHKYSLMVLSHVWAKFHIINLKTHRIQYKCFSYFFWPPCTSLVLAGLLVSCSMQFDLKIFGHRLSLFPRNFPSEFYRTKS